ncbi:MAG: SGNH/GDSL hydrolase family protein [Blautia sp.]|nr:SGNH/GDSL hydrolase family protein [Lachnoclostridium sp.]MCM1212193.1 SGNH/GDSL hydrolase family protein [Blautia sp.]
MAVAFKRNHKAYIALFVLLGLLVVIAFSLCQNRNRTVTAGELYGGDRDSVRFLGRYSLDEEETLWFDYTLSGMEFSFTGKKCIVHFVSDFLEEEGLHAVVGVFLNNADTETMRLEIGSSPCDYTVFESGREQTVLIKIVKLSEAKRGTIGVAGMTICGKAPEVVKTPEKERLFQFIGDSITCGMGNETEQDEAFTTLKENGNMTYGAITARNMDADVEFISYSGIGLIWGTSEDTPPMTEMYRHSGFSRGGGYRTGQWENVRKPDVICIHLGTNDAKHLKDSPEYPLFQETYVEFLKDIRAENSSAYLAVCYGPMNVDFESVIREIVLQYQKETGDERSGFVLFDAYPEEQKGVGGHPTVETHKRMAEILTEYLERQL